MACDPEIAILAQLGRRARNDDHLRARRNIDLELENTVIKGSLSRKHNADFEIRSYGERRIANPGASRAYLICYIPTAMNP